MPPPLKLNKGPKRTFRAEVCRKPSLRGFAGFDAPNQMITMNQANMRVVSLSLLLLVSLSEACYSDLISFSNPTPITLVDRRPSAPYGSPITVSGITGQIENITISLSGFNHTYPNDMAAVIVSPQNTAVLLFSGPGFNVPAVNLNFTFDDNAAATLPAEGALASGIYRPGLEQYDDTFPAPGPGGKVNDGDPAPWSYSFAPLFNQNPNGDWNIYLVDTQIGDRGNITGGWGVQFQVNNVPEPSSLSLGVIIAAAALHRRRLRRVK